MYSRAVIERGPSRSFSSVAAVERAQASAASTSSTVRSGRRAYGVALSGPSRDRVDDVDEREPPRAEGLARTPRWRRCRRPARCRRARPRRGPARTAGNASSSSGKNSHVCGLVQSTGGAVSGSRSGQARPSAIGISIVGGLAWASVEPSVNSTIECTTLVGCTTTSMRSNGMSKSRCASITSSPLLTSVAELIVTTGPMSQVGWFERLLGRDVGQLRRGCGRGTGPRWR